MPNVSLSSDLSPLAFSFKMMHRIPLPQLHFDKGPSFKATFCWYLQVNTPFEFGQCNLVDIFWQPSFSWDKNHNTMSEQVSIKIFYNSHRRRLWNKCLPCLLLYLWFSDTFSIWSFWKYSWSCIFLFYSINQLTSFTKFPISKRLKIIQIYNIYKVHFHDIYTKLMN